MRNLLLLGWLLSSCSIWFGRLTQNCQSETSFCEEETSVQCINGTEFRVRCESVCDTSDGLCVSCGDGRISDLLGEECDDGNDIDTDACTNECRFASCGDGVIEEGIEECEDTGRCNINSIDPTLGPPCQRDEECELTGECLPISGDGCDDRCLIEVCGNGIQQGLPPIIAGVPIAPGFYFEECDDGNNIEGDGCTNGCTVDVCGDGIVNRPCVDTNLDNQCNFGEQEASPLEDCDDGLRCSDGSVCLSNEDCGNDPLDLECKNRGSDLCNPQCRIPFCGDGFVSPSEECDDGKQCVTASGAFAPCTTNADCVGVGDGLCENRNGDGCNTQCIPEFCGDGVVNGALIECCGGTAHFFRFDICDDGNNVDGDGCRADCTGAEVCGDGILDVNEVCDDGNTIAGDGCEADCSLICGQNSGAFRATQDANTGHCYLGFLASGFDDGMNWFGAEQDCEARGGYLAVISSAQENSLARAASAPVFFDVASGFHGAPWIGHHDLNNEAFGNPLGFAAVTGEPLSFQNFAPGEPNNFGQIFNTGGFGDEDCVQFNDQLAWNDRDCTNPFQDYLCEIEPNPCGDGVLQAQLGEQCDDNNVLSGDGCDGLCQNE